MPESEGPFQPLQILRVLAEHGVEFVVIGGIAGAIHGSPYATVDVDVVPRRDRANLERLSHALRAMDARVFVSRDESLRFEHDGASLGDVLVWNLATRYGGLDLTFEPAATRGYTDLAARAERVDMGGGVQVSVASLEDIIRSKEVAGREKDGVVLPALRRLLDLQPPQRRRAR